MSINNSYNEEAIVKAIAVALDNFYTNLIKKIDSLNIKAVMKRKNPYLFRAKAMNGAAQIIDAICLPSFLLPRKRFSAMCFLNPLLLPQHKDRKLWQKV